MRIEDLEIRPLDLRNATPREYEGFNALENIIRAEVIPDDPPMPCAEEAGHWKALPDFIVEGAWAAWEPGERMVAFAAIDADYSGDNMHLADFTIEILPEYRRRGLGRELLGHVVRFARAHTRRLLIAGSNERVPAGAEFLKRIGARMGSPGGENQLCLEDVDRELINRWLRQAMPLHDEFDLELYSEPLPEDKVPGIVVLLQELMNDSPHDEIEVEDTTHVAQTFRPFEAFMVAGGRRSWLLLAIHRGDDRVAGMTQVVWSPNAPSIVYQYGTGTLRDFRNRGIGRWLKAQMITKILHDLPEARVIRTGNASSNAPMLKINWELGFKPFISRPFWQVETETVEKYLSGSQSRAAGEWS